MIRNIIFDIGNVLADWRWEGFLRDKGFEGEELKRIARATVQSPVWGEVDRGVWSWEQVMDGFVRNDPELEEAIHRAFDDLTGMVRIRDYAVPWVRELKAKGYRVYYLSNFASKTERECADALIFRGETDGGILSWKEQMIKPDPRIYGLLLSRFGLKAQECVFLDDTPANVEAAENLGIRGIVFRDREQAERELEKLSGRDC